MQKAVFLTTRLIWRLSMTYVISKFCYNKLCIILMLKGLVFYSFIGCCYYHDVFKNKTLKPSHHEIMVIAKPGEILCIHACLARHHFVAQLTMNTDLRSSHAAEDLSSKSYLKHKIHTCACQEHRGQKTLYHI